MLNVTQQMVQYIQPFAKTCQKVFKSFVGAELAAESPYFFDQKEMKEWDIFGIIGFSGEVRGSMVISMKKGLALKLTTILTSKIYTELDQDVLDTVGEIINIIAGNVKQGFENPLHLLISLPIIVRGQGHSISWLADDTQIICLPFKIFENDEFILSISLKKEEIKHES